MKRHRSSNVWRGLLLAVLLGALLWFLLALAGMWVVLP